MKAPLPVAAHHAPPDGEASVTRGRAAGWADPAARKRDYRQRQSEKLRLLNDLLASAPNARWADPALHRVAQYGEDAELLATLIAQYHWQPWCHVKSAGPEEGGSMPSD